MRRTLIAGAGLMLALAVSTAVPGIAPVSAQVPTTKPIEGVWSGEVVKEGRPVPVPMTMIVTDQPRGSRAGDIVWGAPWVCKSTLQFSGVNDKTFLLTLDSGNGPHCDSLRNGHAQVTPDGSDKAEVVIFDAKNKLVHKTRVERTARGQGAAAGPG